MSEPLLSVIMPVYNAAAYVRAAINSILNQTYKNLELLIIDDGSTDESLAICRELAKADNRIIIRTKENGGQASARNMALDSAHGKYLTFVDSDDELLDVETYSNAIAILEDNDNVDIVHFPYFKIFPDGRREQGTCCGINDNVTLSAKNEYFESIEVVTDYMKSTRVLSSGQWDKVFRASLFDGIRYESGRLFEDTYLSCDLYAAAKSIVLTPIGAYGYIMRPGSTTTSKRSLKLYRDQLDSQIRVLRFLIESGGNEYAVKATLDALSKFIVGVFVQFGVGANLSVQCTSLSKCAKASDVNGFWSTIHKLGLYSLMARISAVLYLLKKKFKR